MKSRKDDLRDIGIIILEVLNLAKEFDYKSKDYKIREDIIEFILNGNNCKNVGPFRNLLKGLII